MKTNTKRFIVIFSIALVISLAIPHTSLWDFGVAPASAASCTSSPVIPGHTKTWHYTEPLQKQDPPRNCFDQYHEADPSSGLVGARIDHELIQAGGQLTIQGTASKLCDTCDGWEYTCRTFTEYTCKKTSYVFWYTCRHKPCPSDLSAKIGGKGDGTKFNVVNIIVAIIVIIAIIVSFGGASPAAAGAAAAGGTFLGMSSTELLIVAGVVGSMQEATECKDCWSVCGKDYETDAGPAPICNKGSGLADVPISYKNATYDCTEGYCGKFENREIKIEVRDESGAFVMSDTTIADGMGQFSYTLTAPVGDGEYTAIVSIPGIASA